MELCIEEVRLSFVCPDEIKRMEVVLDPQESPEEIKSREVELGSESWTLSLQLFLSSSATDIVLVAQVSLAVETAVAWYTSRRAMAVVKCCLMSSDVS